MSLILDALNKADRDRNKNSEQPSDNDSPSAPNVHHIPPKLKIGVIVASTCVVLLLASGAYYWGRSHSKSSEALIEAQAKPETAIKPVVKLAANEAQPPQVKRPPIAKASGSKNLSPKDQHAIDEQYARAAAVKNAPSAAQEHAQPREVAALYEKKTLQPQPAPTLSPSPAPPPAMTPTPSAAPTQQPTPQPTPPPTPEPKQKQQPTLADFTEIGSIRSLPWTIQEKIPSLTYSAHDFESMQKNSVVINGAERHRGDTIEKGLVLEMILPDGIILRYEGRVFKVPALNSWVNM
ncbi:type II secretion system (T2SS) protein B [Alteromonadaceae bacterium 2753L.S.0a.02]|nr:type II secretion system (T2SS) protein B [Alteromonadaceae bacterium 2753L.S.0a.02]